MLKIGSEYQLFAKKNQKERVRINKIAAKTFSVDGLTKIIKDNKDKLLSELKEDIYYLNASKHASGSKHIFKALVYNRLPYKDEIVTELHSYRPKQAQKIHH